MRSSLRRSAGRARRFESSAAGLGGGGRRLGGAGEPAGEGKGQLVVVEWCGRAGMEGRRRRLNKNEGTDGLGLVVE